jgi:hypothetical protein
MPACPPGKVLTVWTKRVINGRDEAVKYPDGASAKVEEGGTLVVYGLGASHLITEVLPIAAFNADQWLSWGFVDARKATLGFRKRHGQDRVGGPYVWAFYDEKLQCLYTTGNRVITSAKEKVEGGTVPPGVPVLVPAAIEPSIDVEEWVQ